MRRIIAAAILLWGPSLTSAGINSWSAIGPAGASVNTVVFGKTTGTVFATASSGVYRSLDDGATWQAVKTDFLNGPRAVAIDPSDASRVYVLAPNWPSLYVSTDGGASLQASGTIPTVVTQATQVGVSQDGRTLYIASGNLFLYSSDRGQTWSQRPALSADPTVIVESMVVDPSDANSVYLSAQFSTTNSEAVLGSHDGGATWQSLLSAPATSGPPPGLAINAANPMQLWAARFDGAWLSADRGLHWTNVMPGIAFDAVGIDPENPQVVYAASNFGQVFRTADTGGHWTDVSPGTSAGEPASVAVDPNQSARLLLGGRAGVIGSNNSGTTWSSQEAGMLASSIGGFSADATTDRIFVNVPEDGVYQSTAGAPSFLPVNNAALVRLQEVAAGQYDPLLFVLSALARPAGLMVSLTAGLATSPDGGSSWTLSQVVPNGSGSQQLPYMTSSAAAPQTVLVATLSSVYRSIDGGNLWTTANNGLPANISVAGLMSAQSNGGVAYTSLYDSNSGAALGIYRTSDAGLTWSATGMSSGVPTTLFAIDPVAAGTLYGSSSSALLKSSNNGSSWSALNWDKVGAAGTPVTLVVDPLHPQILVASTYAQVARSVDDGATWETLRTTSVPALSATSLMLDPRRPESLLVGTLASGVQQITVAPDLAVTGSAPAGPVASGAPVTFGFTVVNQGAFAATGVVVNIHLPGTAQSVVVTAPGVTCLTGTTNATCTFPVLRAGASVAIGVTANGAPLGQVQVVGSVAADQPDSNMSNNSATLSGTVALISDLSVNVTGNAAAQVGDSLLYTLMVSNAGPNTASASTLAFQLPGGLTAGTVTTAAGSCTTSASGLVSCALNDIATGSSVKVTVAATAAVTGSQLSTIQVSSAAADPASANNTATITTSVTSASAAAPAVTTTNAAKSGGGSFSLWSLLVLGLVVGRMRGVQFRSGHAHGR